MKRIALTILTIVIISLLTALLWPNESTHLRLIDAPSIATRFRAKEFCTCYYLLKQELSYCDDWTKDIALNAHYQLDNEQKTVSAWFTWPFSKHLLYEHKARFLDDKSGCRLDPFDG
jgi:hypothetical protein